MGPRAHSHDWDESFHIVAGEASSLAPARPTEGLDHQEGDRGTESASGALSIRRDAHMMKHTIGIVVVALAIASPVSAQTMYRCHDLGKTIYSDKPCLNGDEIKQIAPNGNPTAEYLARIRMKARADEQRAIDAARAAKRDAELRKVAKCARGATAPGCEP
jgi:hypothetical protein